jgi:hypothetical protein
MEGWEMRVGFGDSCCRNFLGEWSFQSKEEEAEDREKGREEGFGLAVTSWRQGSWERRESPEEGRRARDVERDGEREGFEEQVGMERGEKEMGVGWGSEGKDETGKGRERAGGEDAEEPEHGFGPVFREEWEEEGRWTCFFESSLK